MLKREECYLKFDLKTNFTYCLDNIANYQRQLKSSKLHLNVLKVNVFSFNLNLIIFRL